MYSLKIARSSRVRRGSPWYLGLAALLSGGCATGTAPAVSPDEMPQLEARVASNPDDGDALLRYAAGLSATNRCDSALVVARRGSSLKPADALGPLVIGQCHEQASQYDRAIPVYEAFVRDHDEARGVPSVRARLMFAQRQVAADGARAAIANEQALPPADPQTVAVLPLTVTGDSIYQPLSRGLAQIITSDLVLLQRFRMVERLQLGAILAELQLAQTGRVDQATAARAGRLMSAGRMVSGQVIIPSDGDMRLEASIVQVATSELSAPQGVGGRFRDLMQLEKDLVVSIAAELGYQLTDAERAMILENGTDNVTAFLAYSNGLLSEDLGDYLSAAAYFTQAVTADPNFQEARTRRETTTAAPSVQTASAQDVTTISTQEVQDADTFGVDPVRDALAGAVNDLASTKAEQTTETADNTRDLEKATIQPVATQSANPPPQDPLQGLTTATIRIIFRLP